MRKRLVLALAIAAVAALAVALYRPTASDRTPEGAYVRVAKNVMEGRPEMLFHYLERDAQWSGHTLRDVRKRCYDRVAESYPEPERSRLLAEYEPFATAADGSGAFAALYRQRGWDRRLRRDMSGFHRAEIEGERATVVTVRGTRYPFRVRENGMWGLTIFTAELVAEAERASRDLEVVSRAADDFDRARTAR